MSKITKPMYAKSMLFASLLTSATLIPNAALASGYSVVTDSSDTLTYGTLRYALEVEKASEIYIAEHVGDIDISNGGTLNYSKRKPLTIYGSGQTIKTDDDFTLLALTNGASLTAKNLAFVGPGNFDVNNRADGDGMTGKGIFIDVRDDQKGTVSMYLKNVTVADVANHGIHISDCTLADDCGSGSGGAGDGSNASISLHFYDVTIDNAGNGKFDADGLRVDERGKGSIFFKSYGSTFKNVGADGVELDEGDNGGVFAYTAKTSFDKNGNYCDPSKFVFEDELTFAGELSDDEIEQARLDNLNAAFVENQINNDFTCVEAEAEFDADDNETTIEFGLDLDDGIDLDEAGKGSIEMTMVKSTVTANLDEGVDLDEEGKGRLALKLIDSQVIDNRDDGVKLTEEDEGGLVAKLVRSFATGNDKGYVLEELGKGGLWFDIIKTDAIDNNNDGFEIEESDNGSLEGNVFYTSSTGNDGKGFDLNEAGNGNLFVKFFKTISDNSNDGIEADQEDAGNGAIKVRSSDIKGGIDLDGVEEI